MLAQTINVAFTPKLIAKKDLAQVIVDSTVQRKAIAHPTDSKLLDRARAKLVCRPRLPGGDAENPGISIKHRGKLKQLNIEELKLLMLS